MKKLMIFTIVLNLAFFACSKQKSEKAKNFGPDNKMKVTTTIGMIGNIAEIIGGDRVKVYTMMGPGVDPHLYKAKARDIQRLEEADLILYSGLHLEAKLGELMEEMSKKKAITAVSETIPKSKLIDVGNGVHDPHVWFDVSLWRESTKNIYKSLADLDPAGKSYYEKRYKAYDKEMQELDKYVQKKVKELPKEQRVLITAHDAFNYFGKAYGFDVRGLQGISTVDEAGTGDIKRLADFIAKNKIGALFVETSVSDKSIKALQAAVRDRGFEIKIGGQLFSDAMGTAGTPEGTYLGMVRYNVNTILAGLKHNPKKK